MNEVIEALKRIETTFSMNKEGKPSAYRGCTNSIYPYYEDFDLVLNAVERLEAIDNANPNEALKYIQQFTNEMTYWMENPKNCMKNYGMQIFGKYKYTFETTIKQALLKAQEQDKEIDKLENQCLDVLADNIKLKNKAQEQEKENEILKMIIKCLFDRGCPLHQYNDRRFGLTIEVDKEISIMHLGEFNGIDLDKKLKEVLKNEKNN